MLQAVEQGGHREQLGAGRRQFKRQRKAIQPPAYADDGWHVGRHQVKARPHRADPIEEEGDRRR